MANKPERTNQQTNQKKSENFIWWIEEKSSLGKIPAHEVLSNFHEFKLKTNCRERERESMLSHVIKH